MQAWFLVTIIMCLYKCAALEKRIEIEKVYDTSE